MENTKSTALTIAHSQQVSFVDKMMASVESFDKAKEFGQFIINSGFAPKHFDKPEMVVLAIDAGRKIGLDWFQSLQEGFIVNGIPGYKGKILKALVLASGICEKWDTAFIGDLSAGTRGVQITYKRKGHSEMTREYTTDMAKMAGLWGKKKKYDQKAGKWVEYDDVWCKNPQDMLEWKCVSRVLNDFADITKGFRPIEDLVDYKEDQTEFVTNDGITVSQVVNEKAESITAAAKNTGTGTRTRKGAPETVKKIEPIQDAVEVKDVKEEPKQSIPDPTIGMDQLSSDMLWQRLSDNLSFDPMLLFANGVARSTGKVKKILTAIKNGALEEHLSAAYPDFKIPEAGEKEEQEEAPAGEAVEYDLPEDITEPGTGGRDIKAQTWLADFIEKKVEDPETILSKFDKSRFDGDIENFFKFASLAEVAIAIQP